MARLSPAAPLPPCPRTTPPLPAQEGDVLRFCTFWSMGQLEGAGLASTIGNFGGAPSWKLGMFDCAKVPSAPRRRRPARPASPSGRQTNTHGRSKQRASLLTFRLIVSSHAPRALRAS